MGVTGNIACGKSTVARMFKTKDCLLIDADDYARRLLAQNLEVCEKIKMIFGRQIFKCDNRLDRKKLAKVVFADKAALVKLNRIVHPPLIREIKRRIKNSGKKIIILDAALIIEAGLKKMVDKLVVVKAKKNQQILRGRKNKLFGKQDLVLRMKSQIPLRQKCRLADFIIDNSGEFSKTRKQVSEIRRKLWKS